jgi:hypothetical protein
MKLTWSDIEAHKSAVTALQWKRLAEYFRDGKTLSQVGRDEDHRSLKGTKELSIGRACIRILRSMLDEHRGSAELGGPTPLAPQDTVPGEAHGDRAAGDSLRP